VLLKLGKLDSKEVEFNVGARPSISAASAGLGKSPDRFALATIPQGDSQTPDIDQTRGLCVPVNENTNRMGWCFYRGIVGGPGRNRTTDTRISWLVIWVRAHEPGIEQNVVRQFNDIDVVMLSPRHG